MVNKKLATLKWSAIDSRVAAGRTRGVSDKLITILVSKPKAVKEGYSRVTFGLSPRLLSTTRGTVKVGATLDLQGSESGMFLLPHPNGRKITQPTAEGARAIVAFVIKDQYAKLFANAEATHVEADENGIAFELTYQ